MDFNSFNRELQCDDDIIDINLPLAGLSGKLERCERCAISLRSDSIGSRRQCGRGPQKGPFCWPLQELGLSLFRVGEEILQFLIGLIEATRGTGIYHHHNRLTFDC